MSCDWDIRCVDCGADAGIDNANHGDDLMRAIVACAPELKTAIEKLWRYDRFLDIDLRISSHHVSLDFLVQHGGHRLRPVDEYGRFDTPCGATFRCPRCGVDVACSDREHPGKFHGHYVGHVYHQGHEEPPYNTSDGGDLK